MLTLAIAALAGGAVGTVRVADGLARAPWLRWHVILIVIGALPVLAGGVAAGAALAPDIHPLPRALLAIATIPFWAGPRRVVEFLSHAARGLRFAYLAIWARAVTRMPCGQEPPANWHFDRYSAELEAWPAGRIDSSARLLADRLRDWRTGAILSPVEDLRRELQGARWLGSVPPDPEATRLWQLYVAYWTAIADCSLPQLRSKLKERLFALRGATTAGFVDIVVQSLATPLPEWPWAEIEAQGRAVFGDGRRMIHADLEAANAESQLPLPRFVPDWGSTTVPLRIR